MGHYIKRGVTIYSFKELVATAHEFEYMHRLRTYYLPFNHTGTAKMQLRAITE